MKKWSKCLLALMGAAILCFSGKTTARAAEAPAPFTAEQLMAVVNAQCANVNSLKEVLAESVLMTDTSSQMTIALNLVMDVQQNRTVSHSTTSMVMNMMGISQGAATESYSMLSGTDLYSYTLNPAGGWSASRKPLSAAELAEYASPFCVNGIDTKTAAVTMEGNICRVRGTLDAASMASFAEMLESSGVAANGAFPVVLDIDAATMLPVSMTVAMQGMSVDSMPGMTAQVNVVITFADYNQYGALSVPAAVIANAA